MDTTKETTTPNADCSGRNLPAVTGFELSMVQQFDFSMVEPFKPQVPPYSQEDARWLDPCNWVEVEEIALALQPTIDDFTILFGDDAPDTQLNRAYSWQWNELQTALRSYWIHVRGNHNVPRLHQISRCSGGISMLKTVARDLQIRDRSMRDPRSLRPGRASGEPSQQEQFDDAAEELRAADARVEKVGTDDPRFLPIAPQNKTAYLAWLQSDGCRLYLTNFKKRISWDSYCEYTAPMLFDERQRTTALAEGRQLARQSTFQMTPAAEMTAPFTLREAHRGYGFWLAQGSHAESVEAIALYHHLIDAQVFAAKKRAAKAITEKVLGRGRSRHPDRPGNAFEGKGLVL